MDTKQLLLLLLELTVITLRGHANEYGRYENGAHHRLDLAFTSMRSRLSNGEHDEATADVYPDPKHLLRCFCYILRKSLALDKDPETGRIDHPTDQRIDQVFFELEGRLSDGEFDSFLNLCEDMAISAYERSHELTAV